MSGSCCQAGAPLLAKSGAPTGVSATTIYYESFSMCFHEMALQSARKVCTVASRLWSNAGAAVRERAASHLPRHLHQRQPKINLNTSKRTCGAWKGCEVAQSDGPRDSVDAGANPPVTMSHMLHTQPCELANINDAPIKVNILSLLAQLHAGPWAGRREHNPNLPRRPVGGHLRRSRLNSAPRIHRSDTMDVLPCPQCCHRGGNPGAHS